MLDCKRVANAPSLLHPLVGGLQGLGPSQESWLDRSSSGWEADLVCPLCHLSQGQASWCSESILSFSIVACTPFGFVQVVATFAHSCAGSVKDMYNDFFGCF